MSAFPYQFLLDQFNRERSTANSANENRYQAILGELGQRERNAQMYVGRQGQSAQTEIGKQAGQERSRLRASLASRGIQNTSIYDNLRGGIARNEAEAKNSASERMAQMFGDVNDRYGSARTGVMERKTDMGPDAGMYASLFQSLSQADALKYAAKKQKKSPWQTIGSALLGGVSGGLSSGIGGGLAGLVGGAFA